MKKMIALFLAFCMSAAILSGCQQADADPVTSANGTIGGNYTDEMKIPYTCDLEEYGADSEEREGDHENSPYFSNLDYYNMESTDTLTILHNFQTQQQTSEWSCGPSSIVMVLNWFDALGDYNEESLASFRDIGLAYAGTSLRQMIQIFDGVGGFDVYSTYDCLDNVSEVFTFDFIRETLETGTPIIVGWNDWGGHWQVIIGYDTMGTETLQDDVLIVADSYDTTDHNQDGYGVYSAERFMFNFTFYNFFDEETDLNDMCFLVATPQQ